MWPVIVIAFLGLGVSTYWKMILQQETLLQGLCLHLGTGLYERGRTKRGSRTYSFSGRNLGRQFVVALRYRPKGLSFRISGELEIQIPLLQKFWLRMLPRMDNPDPPPGVVFVGDDLIDTLYWVHCNQPGAGNKFLTSSESQSAIRGFRHPFIKLEIYRGWFKITYDKEAAEGFVPGDIEYVLDLVAPMIAAYEAQDMLMMATLAVAAPDPICPYCRGDLDPAQDRIVACAECRTRLHEACWKENGQCTTWGCKSKIADSGLRIAE